METNLQSHPTSPSTLYHALSVPDVVTHGTHQITRVKTYKTYLTLTVSGYAIRVAQHSREIFLFGCLLNEQGEGAAKRGALGTFLWMMQWVLCFAFGRKAEVADMATVQTVQQDNRSGRHLDTYAETRSSFPLERRISSLFFLLMRGMTPRQCQEFKVRFSLRGRISVYRLRCWNYLRLRRARLTYYDHGWWRMPATAAIGGGMWDVQLPPN